MYETGPVGDFHALTQGLNYRPKNAWHSGWGVRKRYHRETLRLPVIDAKTFVGHQLA